MNAAKEVATILASAGVATLGPQTSGWSLFVGYQPESPDDTITVYNTGGERPLPHLLIDFPTVQVAVRASPGGYEEGYSKIWAAREALLGYPSADGVDGRIASIIVTGDIFQLGRDERARPLFTINFRLITHPDTGTYRT